MYRGIGSCDLGANIVQAFHSITHCHQAFFEEVIMKNQKRVDVVAESIALLTQDEMNPEIKWIATLGPIRLLDIQT